MTIIELVASNARGKDSSYCDKYPRRERETSDLPSEKLPGLRAESASTPGKIVSGLIAIIHGEYKSTKMAEQAS
jgi:hypothetical protein